MVLSDKISSAHQAPEDEIYKLDFDGSIAGSETIEKLCGLIRQFSENGLSEIQKYTLAERLAHAAYPKYKFSEFGRLFLEDEEFLTFYRRYMDPGNWHSLDRKYTLNQLLKLVTHLDGDVAECGSYSGFSAYMMCNVFQDSDVQVHLFDSFEGLPEPEDRDGRYWKKGSLSISEGDLHTTLKVFDNYHVYKGWIPDRFIEISNLKFKFLHIDVDLYKPTLDSLKFFYERMQSGGIILMDDYGFSTCPGAKAAADEFFSSRGEEIVMLPTGQAFTTIL